MEKRELLTIPNYVKFGYEIEMDNANFFNVLKSTCDLDPRITLQPDKSLPNTGFEIATPVFKNNKEDINELKELSLILKESKPTFKDCSFQINFNDPFRSDDERVIFLKLYAYYEDLIYKFSRGSDEFLRDSAYMYANLILHELLFKQNQKSKKTINDFKDYKRFGINFKSNNLIEFRSPNGTSEVELWKNYTTIFYYLIEAVLYEKYDLDKLNYYISNSISKPIGTYSLENKNLEASKEKVKEFLDWILIYDIDKEYFLDQYNQEFKMLKLR